MVHIDVDLRLLGFRGSRLHSAKLEQASIKHHYRQIKVFYFLADVLVKIDF